MGSLFLGCSWQAANKTKAANRLMFFMFSRIDSDKNTTKGMILKTTIWALTIFLKMARSL
jgi:hypothetical protein